MTRRFPIPPSRRGCLTALLVLAGVAVALVLLFIASFDRWTDAEREAFARQCALTDTATNVQVRVTGFAFADTLKARRMRGGQVADSFFVRLDSVINHLGDKHFEATLPLLIVSDTYELRVGTSRPFVVWDMGMVMHPQFTMFDEGYGCVFGQYRVDTSAVCESRINIIELEKRAAERPAKEGQ